MVIVWVLIAVALLGFELHHLAFFALFGSIGALAAGLVAAIAPDALLVQLAVGVLVAGLGVVLARPRMSRAFAKVGPGVRIGGVHGGLVLARGITLDEVGDGPAGHVKLLGERWLATSADGTTIPAQTPVIVTQVVGTTLTVRAADRTWELS
jgi:membrane protein implicated in regulation of membrane protease activity